MTNSIICVIIDKNVVWGMIMLKLEEERYNYIDFIRVLAICMVIILHCISGYYNDASNYKSLLWKALGYVNELSRTGVPLFFMISGFLLLQGNMHSLKSFYKRRFLKICIPFLGYDIFYYTVMHFPKLSVCEFIKELFNSGSAYHLWFIYSILFLYLIMPFIKFIIDKCNINMLVLFFVIVIFQNAIRPFINTVMQGKIYLYLSEEFMCGHLGYVILGYIIGKYNVSAKLRWTIYISGLIFFILTPMVSMYSASVGSGFLFHGGYSLNHYAEAAAIFLFFKEKLSGSSCCIPMQELSLATMDAYFIHVFILEELKKLEWNIRPYLAITIWIVLTVSLSFLWGIFRIKLSTIKTKK